jgi:DNA invertase Pin-like site-specific DNA recombinase
MASISGVIDEARDLLEKRIAELDEERRRLEKALMNLIGGKSTTARRRPGRRPGRPRGSTSKKAATPRRRRARRGGTRADQAVKLIADNPGITASEIAKTMKIKPNYLYRVLGELQKEGRVKKKGRQYSAK